MQFNPTTDPEAWQAHLDETAVEDSRLAAEAAKADEDFAKAEAAEVANLLADGIPEALLRRLYGGVVVDSVKMKSNNGRN